MLIGHNNPHLPNPIDTAPWESFRQGHVGDGFRELYTRRGRDVLCGNFHRLQANIGKLTDDVELHRAVQKCDLGYSSSWYDLLQIILAHPTLTLYVIEGGIRK